MSSTGYWSVKEGKVAISVNAKTCDKIQQNNMLTMTSKIKNQTDVLTFTIIILFLDT